MRKIIEDIACVVFFAGWFLVVLGTGDLVAFGFALIFSSAVAARFTVRGHQFEGKNEVGRFIATAGAAGIVAGGIMPSLPAIIFGLALLTVGSTVIYSNDPVC